MVLIGRGSTSGILILRMNEVNVANSLVLCYFVSPIVNNKTIDTCNRYRWSAILKSSHLRYFPQDSNQSEAEYYL